MVFAINRGTPREIFLRYNAVKVLLVNDSFLARLIKRPGDNSRPGLSINVFIPSKLTLGWNEVQRKALGYGNS